MTAQEAREIEKTFQRLWTKAVGTQDYDKREWKELCEKLHAMFRNLDVPSGWAS